MDLCAAHRRRRAGGPRASQYRARPHRGGSWSAARDNAAYGIGHSGLRRVAGRLLRSEKNRRRLEWGRSQLEHHGVWIIVVARFIPGGRTATTYVAGMVDMPWKRRFLPADAIAAALWAL
jgi:membrane-associated protein